MDNQALDLEAAAALSELDLLTETLVPSGGEDGTAYEIYASRCPTKQLGGVNV